MYFIWRNCFTTCRRERKSTRDDIITGQIRILIRLFNSCWKASSPIKIFFCDPSAEVTIPTLCLISWWKHPASARLAALSVQCWHIRLQWRGHGEPLTEINRLTSCLRSLTFTLWFACSSVHPSVTSCKRDDKCLGHKTRYSNFDVWDKITSTVCVAA